jgi:hypothetical protein
MELFACHLRFEQVMLQGTTLYFDSFGVHAAFLTGSGQWNEYLNVGNAMVGVRFLTLSTETLSMHSASYSITFALAPWIFSINNLKHKRMGGPFLRSVTLYSPACPPATGAADGVPALAVTIVAACIASLRDKSLCMVGGARAPP